MDGFATLLEYISPTTASDQNVAKVLGGWTETRHAGHPPTLACFEKEPHQTFIRASQFAQSLRLLHLVKITPKGFADCLAATLLMYYRETMEIAPQHILHQELQRVHATLPPLRWTQEELLEWSSTIRKRFVVENILSLPTYTIKESLTSDEQAEHFVGVHTFADALERLLLGHHRLVASNEELKGMMQQILDRLAHQPDVTSRVCATCGACTSAEPPVETVASTTLPLRPPLVGQPWPKSLTTLKGKQLSDFLVQFVVEGLGSLPKQPGNRGQKDFLRAIEIVARVADLNSIPPLPPTSRQSDVMLWLSAMQNMASQCETLLVGGFTKAADTSQGQRKRRRSGRLTGIVKAWSSVSEQQRTAFRSLPRIRFSVTWDAQARGQRRLA